MRPQLLWRESTALRAVTLQTRDGFFGKFRQSLVTVLGILFFAFFATPSLIKAESREIQPNLLAEFLHNGFWAAIQVDSMLVCAMDGGIGILTTDGFSLSVSSDEPGLFVIRDFFPLDSKPLSLRYDNFTLVVRLADKSYRFFAISGSLKLRELGSAVYPNEVQDYLYKSGNLYFAEEFLGVTMHHVNNFAALGFVDSSMVGVRVIQLALARDTLYALDDYNGILRYANPDFGLQSHAGYLRLPFQIQSFAPHGSRLNLAVGVSGFKSATFDSLGFFATLFERQTVRFAVKVIETDSNYIVISTPNVIEIQDKQDPGAVNLIPISGNTLGATLATFGEKQVFITPTRTTGLQGMWMNVTGYPKDFAGFDHPGPIRSLHFIDGFLYTAGSGNSFEKYNPLGTNGPELLGFRLFPPGTSGSAVRGDTLYMIDNATGVPLMWVVLANRDVLPFPLGTFGLPSDIQEISIHHDFDGAKLFLLRAGTKYYLNRTGPDDLFSTSTVALNLGVGLTAATVERNRVYHYSSKANTLTLSKLDRFLNTEKLFSKNLSGPINAMATVNGGRQILMFSPGRARLFLIRKEFESSGDSLKIIGDFPLLGNYTNAVERDGLIFAVGPNSTGILSLVNDNLQELYHEHLGANLVTAQTGMFATSDGNSIKIYEILQTGVDDDPILLRPADFHLLNNYPNPFNGETLIRFSGSPERNAEARIVVYNVLGRTVRELAVRGELAGVVRWDGRDGRGMAVASGMYFARLITSDSKGRRAIKMIYLK